VIVLTLVFLVVVAIPALCIWAAIDAASLWVPNTRTGMLSWRFART